MEETRTTVGIIYFELGMGGHRVAKGSILYSLKYWQSLNFAIWSQVDITRILAEVNYLAMRYHHIHI